MRSILNPVRKLKHKIAGKQRILGYKKFVKKPNGKRALVSYLVEPVREELEGIETTQFSNNGLGRSIPKVLNRLGYIVDVVNWDDKSFSPKYNYDLTILHGANNYERIGKNLKTSALIHYTTGSYWEYHNNQELKRFTYFYKRHGISLRPDRFVKSDETKLNSDANAIICLGNHDTKATFLNAGLNNVYAIEGASYPQKAFRRKADPNHFLFISGPGNIHKGLDLLLDVFRKHPKFHLHIMCSLDNGFEKYYKDILYKSANIHTYGHVTQRSRQYYTIIDRCMFSVLPSCSEGSPGSVIESMHQGLIPIVTKEAHIRVDGCGFIIKSDKIEDIERQIVSANELQKNKLISLSANSRKNIEQNYTLEQFETKFANIILSKVLGKDAT